MKAFYTYLLAVGCLLFLVGPITAQEEEMMVKTVIETEEPAFSLSGSVDTYFRTNLGGDNDAAPNTSFANRPGFALGFVNLIAGYEGDKVGFTGDLVFGPRGEDAVFASPFNAEGRGSSQIVNQLFAYWNVSDNVTLTLGNFNTFLGYEVISPTANFNYSTSYMFSWGPFSHTGLKADFSFDGGFSAMVGVFNPTDITEFNLTNDYVFGAQLGYDFGNGGAWLNFIFDGANDFTQIDLTAGWDITETLYFGVNATTASDAFAGAAAYLQLATSDSFKIGGRVEYFNDDTGGILGIDPDIGGGNVLDFTISGNYSIANLTLIPEFRIDIVSEDVFPDDTDLGSSLSSFVLAAVYGF